MSRAPKAPPPPEVKLKIVVRNLPPEMTPEALLAWCGAFAPVIGESYFVPGKKGSKGVWEVSPLAYLAFKEAGSIGPFVQVPIPAL